MAILVAAASALGCKNSPTGLDYDPDIDPSALFASVTNAFFPLVPGTTYHYRQQTAEGLETNTVEVLAATRVVNGVPARVVHDLVFLNGNLIEETFDWYAQDAAGNVWYIGEDSREIENGQVVGTEGSWEWGVDGALPGIIMWADPAAHLGEEYRQEFYEGEAEDFGKVVSLNQAVTVPFGSFAGCIETEDWNALESGGRERKFYCPGLGFTLEVKVSGGERLELVNVTP
jgi:hypothetical protein